ncbi:MAG: FadR family transcriptional regulator [Anaerolineales bacterium]|nr:FadR family transcriptional regulator [Anaerolineales bacterium]
MDNAEIFQSVEKPRLAYEVARQIAQAIQEGRFLAGEILPPAREFASKFNVSRPILREALSILQIQGYVTIRHGRGTFVKDPNTDILNVSPRDWLAKNRTLVENFYEARLAIEPVCAAHAAEFANPKDIIELREILERIDNMADSGSTPVLVSADIDFHSMIAKLSRNEFLIKMLASLIVPETDVRKIILRLPNHVPTTTKDHYGIFHAIEKRNPVAARKAMIVALKRPLEVIQDYMKDKENQND